MNPEELELLRQQSDAPTLIFMFIFYTYRSYVQIDGAPLLIFLLY